jgi:hypothetical protein
MRVLEPEAFVLVVATALAEQRPRREYSSSQPSAPGGVGISNGLGNRLCSCSPSLGRSLGLLIDVLCCGTASGRSHVRSRTRRRRGSHLSVVHDRHERGDRGPRGDGCTGLRLDQTVSGRALQQDHVLAVGQVPVDRPLDVLRAAVVLLGPLRAIAAIARISSSSGRDWSGAPGRSRHLDVVAVRLGTRCPCR